MNTKELAVQFAVEYIKSWNAAETEPMRPDEALDFLKKTYDVLDSLKPSNKQRVN